ncbi:MAG: RecX family transcriptional regulator, partial [bacterium]
KLRAGWAPRRVRAELGRRGVDPGLIAEALEAGGPGDPTVKAMSDSLMATVRRRFGPQFSRDPKAAERRLAGFLARRGYDWEEIGRVVRTLRLENGAPARADPGADPSDDPGGLPALDLGGESDP